MENKAKNNPHPLFSSPWQRLPFFNGLPPELIQQVLEDSFIETTRNREVIFEQDKPADSFLFVLEGLFRLFRTNPKGQRVIMDFVGPGGMVAGLLMAQTEITYPITCQSIGQGQILKIPKSTYQKHWMSHPEIIKRTQGSNIERMQALQSTRELQKYSLEEKLTQILLRMSSPSDENITLRVSKTDLADLVGACVESVIRIFSSWEKKGWIIKDQDGFEKIRKSEIQEFAKV